KAIACNPKYGYGIPEENIIGMRLALTDGKLMAKYRDNYEFNYREGKKKNVENIFARARGGKGPLIVAGDADTDWEMMSQFKDTRLGLILNRYKSGKGIARGAAQAVEAQEKKEGNPRYVLQGRNENTGKWVTGMKVLLLGEVDEAENYKLLNK
ncbi:MAG: haloacid dehalogenase-like hydrolase, partial [bacterium]|nr:haloacid dehalogenase-like hydrolase [bacterium]